MRYFAVQPSHTGPIRSFADADRLADIMLTMLEYLDVRLLAVRNGGEEGFVFGFTTRHTVAPQAVVSVLSTEPEFEGYRISAEEPTVEGPFHWHQKEGRPAHERPSRTL
jgi:hypothetical protein